MLRGRAPLLAEPHPSAKTGGRRSRRNEADAPNPAPLISPRFEHEHEHDDEDDLVAAPPHRALRASHFIMPKASLEILKL